MREMLYQINEKVHVLVCTGMHTKKHVPGTYFCLNYLPDFILFSFCILVTYHVKPTLNEGMKKIAKKLVTIC